MMTKMNITILAILFLFVFPATALPEINFNKILYFDSVGESETLNISLLNGSPLSELTITLYYKKGIELTNITSAYPILKKELNEENGKFHLFLNFLTKNLTDNETVIASIEIKALSKGYFPMKIEASGRYENGTTVDVLERYYSVEVISGEENIPEAQTVVGPLLMFMVIFGMVVSIAIVAGVLTLPILIVYAVLKAKGRNIDVRYLIIAFVFVLLLAFTMIFWGVVYGQAEVLSGSSNFACSVWVY
ncbi:hypothetical protein Ferp_0040 [Ferroglobus placidus DSM 10642]|uniref:Uncharacterized protein n=1 Tax=Ferroglobus placidus (strain DSM 10642 / AEDII12DO) TaxID=589924 RepID=D3S0Z6_FERPA|nr:hypothetical protein [Ferroglobus placidus]ADC64232.1 hypothetical protein Ferp_0040 [Ferroglobus placidus DSM 10642]